MPESYGELTETESPECTVTAENCTSESRVPPSSVEKLPASEDL